MYMYDDSRDNTCQRREYKSEEMAANECVRKKCALARQILMRVAHRDGAVVIVAR